MVRVPVVLLGAVERITEVEGWANRQAFMESKPSARRPSVGNVSIPRASARRRK
jgi:hypothetical protein